MHSTAIFWTLYHRNYVLYAPSDYQNQDHYLEANNLSERITEQVDKAFKTINQAKVKVPQSEIDELKNQLAHVVSSQPMSSLSVAILDLLKDASYTERKLGEQLGASRASVRKALRNLERQSLVEHVKIEGTMFASPWKLKT